MAEQRNLGLFHPKGRNVVQGEEYIGLALREGKEFLIPCNDAQHANSMRVSLYNVRRRLKPEDQQRIRIQKVIEGGKHYVKITQEHAVVYELVEGIPVLFKPPKPLSRQNQLLFAEMMGRGMEREKIIETLVAHGEEVTDVIDNLKLFDL